MNQNVPIEFITLNEHNKYMKVWKTGKQIPIKNRACAHTFSHTHTHIYIYIYMVW